MNGTSANFRILSSRHKLVLITVPVSGVGTAGRLGQVSGQGSAPSPTVITLGCSAPAASSFPSPGPRPPQFPAVAPLCAQYSGGVRVPGVCPLQHQGLPVDSTCGQHTGCADRVGGAVREVAAGQHRVCARETPVLSRTRTVDPPACAALTPPLGADAPRLPAPRPRAPAWGGAGGWKGGRQAPPSARAQRIWLLRPGGGHPGVAPQPAGSDHPGRWRWEGGAIQR